MSVPSLASAPPRPRVITWWQRVLTVLYVLLLGLLIGATLLYAASRLYAGGFSTESWSVTGALLLLIATFIIVLYYAEGAEIAVTTIVGLEDERVSGSATEVLAQLRDDTGDFVSGRQFIVVALVVLFTGFCEAYASSAPDAPASWRVTSFFSPIAKHIYASAFPIITALWLSQLFSKYVAHHRPTTFFHDPLAQLIVRPSIWLGRTLLLGHVSVWLTKQSLAGKKDDLRVSSRGKTYEALVAFGDGFGFEMGDVRLMISPIDGSAEITMTFHVRAYAPGGKLFRQADEYDGPVLDVPKPEFRSSRQATSGGPAFAADRRSFRWDLNLAQPLDVGDEFDFQATYSVGAGAYAFGEGALGEFYYEQHKYPIRHLRVSVRLSDTSSYILSKGRIVADVSDDRDTNDRESNRFRRCIDSVDGGYDYSILHPLMGGTYKCEWTVARSVPELPTSP